MNFFQTAILIALVTNIFFGVVVISKKTKRLQNQGFLLTVLVLAVWLTCLLFAAFAGTNQSLSFWVKQSSASSALIPIALNLLRLTLVYRDATWRQLLGKSKIWLRVYPVIFIICQTPMFLRGAELPTGNEGVATPDYGFGFYVFLLYMVSAVVYLTSKYIKNIQESQGIQKVELQFLLIACIFGFFVGVVLTALSNITGITQLGQMLPLPVLTMDYILAYGVATRSILDAPNVMRRLIAFGVTLVYLTLIYVSSWGLVAWALNFIPELQWPLAHWIAALAVAFAVTPARGWMQKLTNKLFVASPPIDVGDTIREANRILNTIGTVDELFRQFAALVQSKIQNEHLRILLLENRCFEQRFSTSGGLPELTYQENHPLVVSLIGNNGTLVLDMIQRMRPTDELVRAEEEMKVQNLAAAVALRSKGQISGIMLLGSRASARIYGVVEQELLTGLCDQLAIAMENAKLYTEVQNSRIYNDILLDRLVSGVIAVNAARKITVFNHEAQRITGLVREKVLQADVELLPPVMRDALLESFNQGGGRNLEGVLQLGERQVPIRYGCTPFHSHTGKTLGALMVFTDQTEVKKLEQQIRRTDRLASLGTLSAGMAHEIKNPLVAMKTFTQLLPERYDDEDFRNTFAELLGEEVARVDRIVNQLLKFARPAKPSLAPVRLHAVIDHTLNLLKQQLRQGNVNVNKEYLAENDLIHGDNDMLTQALLNFILNAIDAMEKGGALWLKTRIVHEPTNQFDLWGNPVTVPRLQLLVIDNGRGISKDDIGHVFDPFYTTKATGTGLGLSVAHGIIVEHQGMIDVESEINQGTTFCLTFPLLQAEVPA